MAAIIESVITSRPSPTITGSSRDDLIVLDVVSVTSVDAATTYSWILSYAPEGSAANFAGDPSAVSPGTFIADLEGPYLIRLTVDAGLPSEDTQYVRLRALTEFGELKLVSAGERRDGTGIIPVDIDAEGWANEQNFNLQRLLGFVKPMVQSGRVLYVDSNNGVDSYADYPTVQEAITHAVSAGASSTEQWVVMVRPGVYVENVTFEPWVHVQGWPGVTDGNTATVVDIQVASTAGHRINTPNASDRVLLANLNLRNLLPGSHATVRKTGLGRATLQRCRVDQEGTNPLQGAAVDLQAGNLILSFSTLDHTSVGTSDRVAFAQTGFNTSSTLRGCTITGPSGIDLNPGLVANVEASMQFCSVTASDPAGFGIRTSATDVLFSRMFIEVPIAARPNALLIHPSGGAYISNMTVTMRTVGLRGDISFNTTGIVGATTLELSASEYRNLTFPGGPVTNRAALTKGDTIYYDNSITALIAENVQDAIDEIALTAQIAPAVYHKNIPPVPNDTVRYRGWVPVAAELIFVRVYMQTVNTQGNYRLAVTNEATGNTCLSAATFNMNSLAPGTVQAVPLTGTLSDLQFASQDRWTIALWSDDPAFDGDSIYVSLVFNTAAGGGPITEDLATTLAVGNITGGNDIVVSNLDQITGVDAPLGSGLDGTDLELRGGAGDGAGVDGVVRVVGKLTVTGLIDPTGVVFTQEDPSVIAGATGAGEGAVFISDGSLGSQADTPYFVSAGGTMIAPLFGGRVYTSSYGAGPTVNVAMDREAALYSVETTAVREIRPRLPAANTVQGRVIYVEHVAGSLGTLNVLGLGGDTIEGSASPHTVVEDTIVAFMSDGSSDWRLLELGGVGGETPQFIHKSVPPTPANTFRYEGWAAADGLVTAIHVYMASKGTTTGNYTATFTNEATGNTMLVAANFDMHSGALIAGVPLALTLTGVPSDLTFSAEDQWSVEFTSDDPGFDGTGIYFDIVWSPLIVAPVPAGAPDDSHNTEITVRPNNTVDTLFFAPYDLTVVGAKVYCATGASTAGVYTLAIEDIDNANNLLAAATFDLTPPSLPVATLTTLTLTGTVADLDLPEGTRVRCRFVSDNGDLLAAGMYLQLIYRDQVGAIPPDTLQREMAVRPANTVQSLFFAPYNLAIAGVRVYCQTGATTAGIYTLAVEDIDNANNLLAAATFDMRDPGSGGSLPAATLTDVPLTATVADLDLLPGTRVRVTLTSDNGDLLGTAGVYVQLIYRSQ